MITVFNKNDAISAIKKIDKDNKCKDMVWFIQAISVDDLKDMIRCAGGTPDDDTLHHVVNCMDSRMDDVGNAYDMEEFLGYLDEDEDE